MVHEKPVIEFVAIKRRDNGQWALPGVRDQHWLGSGHSMWLSYNLVSYLQGFQMPFLCMFLTCENMAKLLIILPCSINPYDSKVSWSNHGKCIWLTAFQYYCWGCYHNEDCCVTLVLSCQGMVDPGDNVTNTLKKEFGEEALSSMEMSEEEREHLHTSLAELFKHGHEVTTTNGMRSYSHKFMTSIFTNITFLCVPFVEAFSPVYRYYWYHSFLPCGCCS